MSKIDNSIDPRIAESVAELKRILGEEAGQEIAEAVAESCRECYSIGFIDGTKSEGDENFFIEFTTPAGYPGKIIFPKAELVDSPPPPKPKDYPSR